MGYMVIRYVKRPTMRVNGLEVGRFYGVAFQSAEYGAIYPSVRYLVDLGLIRFGDRFHGRKIKLDAKHFKEFAYLYARDLDAYSPYMGRRFLYKMKPLIESADSKEVSWR